MFSISPENQLVDAVLARSALRARLHDHGAGAARWRAQAGRSSAAGTATSPVTTTMEYSGTSDRHFRPKVSRFDRDTTILVESGAEEHDPRHDRALAQRSTLGDLPSAADEANRHERR